MIGLRVRRVLVCACLVSGCGGEPEAAGEDRRRRLTVDPLVTVGQTADADPEYLFGDIRSVAADVEGNLYVGDRIGAVVRAYAPDGTFVGTVAEEGDGPGQIYGWPSDLTFGPDGTLHVRDAGRVTLFHPSSTGEVADSLVGTWRYPGYGNLTSAPSYVSDDGTYFYPGGTYSRDRPASYYYVLFQEGEPTGDTLHVPSYPGLNRLRTAYYPIDPSRQGGRLAPGLNRVPFAPTPSWSVSGRGTLWSNDGESSILIETNVAGDTIRRLELQGVRRRTVQQAEREDSLRALDARIDSLPVALEQVVFLGEGVAERELPDSVPSIIGIEEVGDRLWIERWPPPDQGHLRAYDVFDLDGRFLRGFELAAPLIDDPGPYVTEERVVGVVTDPVSGVDRIVAFDPEVLER